MKKINCILLSLLVLIGCSDNPSNTQSSNSLQPSSISEESSDHFSSLDELSSDVLSTGETTSSTEESSPVTISSPIISSEIPSSTSSHAELKSIQEIVQEAKALPSNEKGIATGSRVKFQGQYFAFYTETHGSYDNRLMYFSDGNDYIYVRCSQKIAETTLKINSYYEIEGNVGNHFDHYEVQLIAYQLMSAPKIETSQIATPKSSIKEIYDDIALIPLCEKGIAYDKMVRFTAQYIAKTDNSIMQFYDGVNVISIHGDSKINNNCILNYYYEITGLIGQYIYKPGIEYISSKSIVKEDRTVKYDNLKTFTAKELYNLATSDEKLNYYPYVLHFNGYVLLNQKNQSKDIYSFVDNLSDIVSITSNNQSIQVRNYESYDVMDWLEPYYQTTLKDKGPAIKVDVICTLYIYLTSPHAWSVHVLGIIE